MNTNSKFSFALIAAILFFSACNNNKTKSNKMENHNMGDMKNNEMDKMGPDKMKDMENVFMSGMKMTMEKMNNMKMSGDFDLDFANMMTEHHQSAIDMSNIELQKGTDDKIKEMTKNIIAAQTKEINMFRDIIKNYKKSGMKHGEGMLEKMNAEMNAAMNDVKMTGNVDKDYAMMMISHHEGAVKMFRAELENGMNGQLKQMAKKGITDQTKEISEFKSWLGSN